ncbi:translation initiation factor eIF2 assembly protein [Schizosaccharomyces pombe]|uniref:Translation initiation factor eIF2 assembly protein n=4 Tax=Schizosaccharomyces pombe TaxID=4896 RepID=CD123_SCHPO|nr:D123 family protein [Schizosaccharomyces pombe]Q9P7N5.1 RecName: Full=Translation initiation factor eIF2 assembly protein; AltName: Full=Cell division cycle protein 123 [Schizosaccharomyces pombe 972h-]CAB76024.1 D123 family protein [Schizosaccharomyces pombe]|eukprot:NP_593407.1 D123 family protein [Schizosaccharomyces pombe]
MTLILTKNQVLHCQFSSWYSLFRKLTPKAKVIKPIPATVLKYLHEDSIYVEQPMNTVEEVDSEEDEESAPAYYPEREAIQLIEKAIKELGGAVVPKLNWSTPKDALWITTTGSLKCTTAEEVLLLLKSSDFVAHDLNHAFDDCKDFDNADGSVPKDFSFELVLKEWFPMHASTEFRCFVKSKRLIAFCQRDDNYYEFLKENIDCYEKLISDLLKKLDTFPDPDFVFDVYIHKDRAWLIDINPFYPRTDGLLFSWSELESMNSENMKPEIRLIPKGSMPSTGSAKYYTNRVPFDMIAASEGENLLEFAQKWQDLTNKSNE